MENAKKSAQLFLKSLPEKILFNIIAFDNKFTYPFSKSARYDSKTLNEASEFVS
jgi:hypothetical protein